MLLRDQDRKFGQAFDGSLREARIKPVKLPRRSPNLNAFCERVIQTLQVECLDHFMVLGTRHLDYLTSEYSDYYNRQRPHSAIEFRAPAGVAPPSNSSAPSDEEVIRCVRRLGGLIKHYHRQAA